ncbi:hypothetical protein F7734_39375 [Scytonema sp. UIC 10036]|uniref:hypothetical protein n=1 Tax=Scytonema sp. UIC 10036 TaxID=2304196 RepID=UPI0012DA9A7B|nr:hypothetical protein [Scytonema sp. UIC 10036]MUG98051.1 hypothetical protein [Scytonema sp. UIC 10036]
MIDLGDKYYELPITFRCLVIWQLSGQATLDPMGMPLVSATKEGNGADDPLY